MHVAHREGAIPCDGSAHQNEPSAGGREALGDRRVLDANRKVCIRRTSDGQRFHPIALHGGFSAGQTRNWQIFYREDETLVCNTGQNTSNAAAVTFTP